MKLLRGYAYTVIVSFGEAEMKYVLVSIAQFHYSAPRARVLLCRRIFLAKQTRIVTDSCCKHFSSFPLSGHQQPRFALRRDEGRKHLTGNIREAFCDSGPGSVDGNDAVGWDPGLKETSTVGRKWLVTEGTGNRSPSAAAISWSPVVPRLPGTMPLAMPADKEKTSSRIADGGDFVLVQPPDNFLSRSKGLEFCGLKQERRETDRVNCVWKVTIRWTRSFVVFFFFFFSTVLISACFTNVPDTDVLATISSL